MKAKATPSPDALRALLLTIVRASVAGSLAGCSSAHVLEGDDSDDAGSGTALEDGGPKAPGHDSAVMLDASGDVQDGSSTKPDAGDEEEAGWERVPCAQQGFTAEPASVPDSRTSAIMVYQEGPSLDSSLRYAVELVSVGSLCSGADNVATCELQVTALKSMSSCPDACQFAIAQVDGELRRLDTSAELLALLGSVDSVADAVLVAGLHGHRLCPGASSDPRDIGTEARAAPGSGYELRITREDCSESLYRERLTVGADGTPTLVSRVTLAPSLCVIGRRPAGLLVGAAATGRTRLGAFLAQAAHLEAASVHAFYKLLRELRALSAPETLRRAALDAMLDEVRHAQDVGELARAYGGEITKPAVAATGLRSPFELALENVSEGCVRETFGALQATYQAATATDPRVRGLMAKIADDESRHAALAWQLQAWLEPRLSEPERARVAEERARALDDLAADLDAGLSPEEHAELGFPTPEVSGNMLRSFSQALFA